MVSSTLALLLLAAPDSPHNFVTAQLGPGGCATSYDCCVKNHPYDAVDACGYPPGVARGPSPKPETTPTPEPVKTTEPVPAPEPVPPSPPTRQPSPLPDLRPDVFVKPERNPEEAVRRRPGGSKPVLKPPKPNEVSVHEEGWQPVPGEPPWRPCDFRGGGGKGGSAGNSLPANWIRCSYQCGRYQVVLYDVWGTSTLDCDRRAHLERAERAAREFDAKG